jgi:hypothetical protein
MVANPANGAVVGQLASTCEQLHLDGDRCVFTLRAVMVRTKGGAAQKEGLATVLVLEYYAIDLVKTASAELARNDPTLKIDTDHGETNQC